MSFTYNGAEFNPPVPSLIVADTLAAPQSPCEITYLSAHHVTEKDFDPAWDDVVSNVDLVFHEGPGWLPSYRPIFNVIAWGNADDIVANEPKGTYTRRRLESIAGTRVRQALWDASQKEVEQLGLDAYLTGYHDFFVEAENKLRAGDEVKAIESMGIAQELLYEYEVNRDTIGMKRVTDALAKMSASSRNEVSQAAVFVGSAHTVQAFAIEHALPESPIDIRVLSLIDDPIGVSMQGYLNYLTGVPNEPETVLRIWARGASVAIAAAEQPTSSRAEINNYLEAALADISADEAIDLIYSSFRD